MNRLLACTRCGGSVVVCENVVGFIEWGRAVVDEHGVVHPASPAQEPQAVMADNGRTTSAYAVCEDPDCGHRWTLRRRFDSMPITEGRPPHG